MIGLDTNVLIRYLTQDDPILSPKATSLIEKALTAERSGFVSVVTMAEIGWVLESYYDLSNEEIADAIEGILSVGVLEVERRSDVFTAATLLRSGAAEFSDALIGLLGLRAGCSRTLTFDRKASRLAGFELLV